MLLFPLPNDRIVQTARPSAHPLQKTCSVAGGPGGGGITNPLNTGPASAA